MEDQNIGKREEILLSPPPFPKSAFSCPTDSLHKRFQGGALDKESFRTHLGAINAALYEFQRGRS